jgi:hypothetical protein
VSGVSVVTVVDTPGLSLVQFTTDASLPVAQMDLLFFASHLGGSIQ